MTECNLCVPLPVTELVLHWVEQIHAYTFEQGDASSPLELGLLHEIRQLSKKGEHLPDTQIS